MTIEADIFKGKHFPKDSRDRLKAIMVSLAVYFPSFVLAFDFYESVMHDFKMVATVELSTIFLLYAFYLSFPRYLSIRTMSKILLFIYSVYLSLTLFLPDYNAEFSIFWFAPLSFIPFFLLGHKEGKFWVALPVLSFLLVWLVTAFFDDITLPYNKTFLIQLLFSYLLIAYIIYIMEKERYISEKKLIDSVESNKLLFKEVHHRTKNNMQVIMGLLETQSFKIDDLKYKKMFQAHVERIKSMSFVHENLYKGASHDEVDMHKYLEGVLNNLQKITQHTIIADIDYVTLGIKDSISLGLIVNEAVSNALEHAYSAGTEQIDVSLKDMGTQYALSIKDYGVGFNTQREFQSLGMTLIEDLSASLPNGRLEVTVDDGTCIQVYFDIKGEI